MAMKLKNLLLFVGLLFTYTLAVAHPQCVDLFTSEAFEKAAKADKDKKVVKVDPAEAASQKISYGPSEKDILSEGAISYRQITNESANGEKLATKVVIINEDLNQQKKEFELIRLLSRLVYTTSFKIDLAQMLKRDKLVFGIPMKDGYSFELTYASDGRETPNFDLKEVSIITPSPGAERIQLTEEKSLSAKIRKNELTFEVPKKLPKNLEISVRVPSAISGDILNNLTRLSEYLSLYPKEKLRDLFAQKSMTKIMWSFRLQKSISLFKKYFIAGPFKFAITGGLALAVASVSHFSVLHPVDSFELMTAKTSWVNTAINEVAARDIAPEVKMQLADLREEANRLGKDKANLTTADVSQALSVTPQFKFSSQHMTWVLEKKGKHPSDPQQTYIVFTEEASGSSGGDFKYIILPIDPSRYSGLIEFIRQQGLVVKGAP